jgi:hypothetical protein
MFTAYMPASVPEGAPLPSVIEVDCPEFSVTDGEENAVDQPEGSLEPRFMVFAEHPGESLFVTETE